MDERIYQIAEQIVQIHQKAYEVYLLLVEEVCNRTASEDELSHLSDYLLDFACDEKMLGLYKKCVEDICMYILTVLSFTSKHIGKCGERRITMAKIVKETIHAKGIDIGIYTTNFENEFISLTDIAKYRNEDDPRFVIQNWMRNRNTIEFLGVWEELHNPDFNRVQFEAVKNEAGLNRFVMTPTKWITQMNAIGIVSKAGRYGGTYAHSDIAMSFATWISPEFQLYIMKDYRRLKTDENSRLSLNCNLNREISKLNYRIHTDAIKENLMPPELTPAQVAYTYANEAEMYKRRSNYGNTRIFM